MPQKPLERVRAKREKITKEIEDLQRALFNLNTEEAYASQLTDLCPSCKGKCEERYTDAAGSGDWRDCSTCKGWGYISKGVICPECKKSLDDMTHLRRESMPHCPFCGKYLGQLFREVPS